MRDVYLANIIIVIPRCELTKTKLSVVVGAVLSATLLSVFTISFLNAYGYHDSIVAKQYSMKNSNVQSPSIHTVSITGKLSNIKGAQGKDPAFIDLTIHKWNQFKPGATYSVDKGTIKTGSQEYKVESGVMIVHKSDEFLIIMKNQRGELFGKLHGYLNGGYQELQENKPVKLLIDKDSPVSLSNDGRQLPKRGTFIAEVGTLNPRG